MAKTPLLCSLRLIWRDVVRARKLGMPVSEFRDQRTWLQSTITRRQALLAGAVGLTPSFAHAKRPTAVDASIGIVGGGIAGLTCGLTLADEGVRATVYEASGRVGGRMFSNRSGYWDAGQVTEWGGELIDSGHETVRSLARRYGLPLDNLLAAQPKKSDDTYFLAGGYYPKSQADADFDAVYDVVIDDEASAPFPTTYDDFTSAGQALDQMSVYDWIETRIPGGHASALGQVLDLAYTIEYGADSTDQSALNLLYLLAYQPAPQGLAVFGESDEKYHIRGGNQRLPEAIAADLSDRLVLDEKLVKIAETSSGRYRLTFKRGSSTREVSHDYVVLALPFAVLANIDYQGANFDSLKQQAIAEQGRGRNGKLQLQFAGRGWLGKGPWPGVSNGSSYSDTGYQAGWEATRAQAGDPGIVVLYSGGSVTQAMRTNTPFATASNAKVRSDALTGYDQLAPVYPGLDWNGKATQSLPHLSSLFNASYSYYRVGQYTAFAGYEKVRQGGVLFCGEHTSTDFQGFMEGGASEGVRAAEELLELVVR